jgi:hypothetical protein
MGMGKQNPKVGKHLFPVMGFKVVVKLRDPVNREVGTLLCIF